MSKSFMLFEVDDYTINDKTFGVGTTLRFMGVRV